MTLHLQPREGPRSPSLSWPLGSLEPGYPQAAGAASAAPGLAEGLTDLRYAFEALRAQVEALQRAQAEHGAELSELASQLTEVRQRVEAGAHETARTAQTLAAAARLLERTCEEDFRHRRSLTEEWRQHQQQLREFVTLFRENQQKTGEALANLKGADEGLWQRLGENLQTLARVLGESGTRTSAHLHDVHAGLGQLALVEQTSLEQLAQALEQVQASERSLTESLNGIGSATANLVKYADWILEEQRRSRQQEALAEARRLNRLGLRCLSDGDYGEAVRHFELASRQAPETFEPRFNLALAHYRHGRLADALEVIDRLLPAFPERAETRFLRGLIGIARGDFASARRDMAAIVGAAVQNQALQAAAGFAHLLSSDPAAALEAFRRAAGSPGEGAQLLCAIGFHRS